MRYRVSTLTRSLLIAVCSVSPISFCLAKDHFLTIGGGYDPTGNQASLESNVLMLQRVLDENRPDRPQHDVFFADGDDPGRDLQFVDDQLTENCPPSLRIMTEIFGHADAVGQTYRNHRVPDVVAPADRSAIRRRFRELGRDLQNGDRLFVYFTGHGDEAETDSDDYDYEYDYDQQKWTATTTDGQAAADDNPHNTSIYFWDSESVEAREFGRWLDRIPSEVTVVLVMVQCFSGGFSHAIFQRHSPELGLSPSRRCGFFSQVHDRPAAGCTSESNEADYQEYSTFFLAALGGKTRVGEPIDPPDYNGDNRISLAEAHAYAIIQSDTIDIPVRTSDAFLRHFSSFTGRIREQPTDNSAAKNPVAGLLSVFGGGKKKHDGQLLDASGALADLLPLARADQRAIMEQLPAKLRLENSATVEQVRTALSAAESNRATLSVKADAAAETQQELKSELRDDLYALWPELQHGFSPILAELTMQRADEFVEAVEALASYQAWAAAKQLENELADKLHSAQCAEARVQRLLRTIESVVLAKNLPTIAPAEIVDRYHQLLALEEATLDAPPPVTKLP